MKSSLVLLPLMIAAGSVAALAGACSSSSDTGTSGTTADSGTSGTSGASGTSGTSGTAGTSGTSGTVLAKDTCISAGGGNTCQCSCGITGQTENTSLHCVQPAKDTGQCAKVCCTGEIDSGTSGTTSSGGVDAGDGG
jgi:hypothetical protein